MPPRKKPISKTTQSPVRRKRAAPKAVVPIISEPTPEEVFHPTPPQQPHIPFLMLASVIAIISSISIMGFQAYSPRQQQVAGVKIQQASSVYICADSDAAMNPNTQGELILLERMTGSERILADSCADADTLLEGYCSPGSKLGYARKSVSCPSGVCMNGACAPITDIVLTEESEELSKEVLLETE